ncbi:MAG: preprotein translocase subunit YajC [Planctomycetota bacterium]|jgi:preprotein translocase YajC subunit|nr:preprotein translocase subunit YajC [Planctomycetota bacterium]
MAEETSVAPGGADISGAPSFTQGGGETTSVAENAQATQEQPAGAGEPVEQPAASIWDNWLLYAVILFWVWWLFGNKKRKAQKQQEKKEQARRNALQKGDNIVTIGRMHGKVVAFTEDTVTIKPDPGEGLTMTFDRQAIFRVLPRPGEDAGKDGDPETK